LRTHHRDSRDVQSSNARPVIIRHEAWIVRDLGEKNPSLLFTVRIFRRNLFEQRMRIFGAFPDAGSFAGLPKLGARSS
jgi:hypothetical protein